ncbi:acyltransferase family protein [Nocardia grenadensis]|uniref:acyltransferase family protein n=1 Tax=Nocardia grenadensis TaxID=931537 RepID=UPI003D8EF009
MTVSDSPGRVPRVAARACPGIGGGAVADRTSAGARTGAAFAGNDPSAAAYRADLDGLRGIAIALVVVFHIWMGRVSGGVDVFLVLSGFFFTGLLLRRADATGSVGVWFTVRRTLRRLLPALIVVLIAVVGAAVVLRPYTQWADIATQTLASMFYYQNWQLAWSWSDYLAADPSVSPLQHLWSMSVQGQYYLAALLVVAGVAGLCRGHRRRARPVLAVLVAGAAATSFGYAAYGMVTYQGWNYYDSYARAWELLAGAALVLAAPFWSPPRPLRHVLAWLGLAGVVGCGWLIVDGANRFPGPAALVPVGACVALILSGSGLAPEFRPWPNRILATSTARRLGDIAYPLYLWHWPILIFYLAYREQPEAGPAGGMAIIALSVLLAWCTHRWVEQPLRLRSRPGTTAGGGTQRYQRIAGSMVSVGAVALVAVTVVWQALVVERATVPSDLEPPRYPGAEALASDAPVPEAPVRPGPLQVAADLPPSTLDGCIADWDTRDVITCTYGDPGADRTIALAGSSHVEHWLPAFQVLAEQHSFRIRTYLKMGCALTIAEDATYRGEAIPDCRDWSREVIERLGAERPDWVFTIGTHPRLESGDETPPGYPDVWAALADQRLNVIAIRDTPWLRRDGGVPYRAGDCLAFGGTAIDCGMHRIDALDEINPGLEPASRFPNVFPIDLSDAVCTAEVCPVVVGNILVYHDEHHLSASFSRSLAGPLGRALHPLLRWW